MWLHSSFDGEVFGACTVESGGSLPLIKPLSQSQAKAHPVLRKELFPTLRFAVKTSSKGVSRL